MGASACNYARPARQEEPPAPVAWRGSSAAAAASAGPSRSVRRWTAARPAAGEAAAAAVAAREMASQSARLMCRIGRRRSSNGFRDVAAGE